MNGWDKYFMDMAIFVSQKSKDRSIGVGVVITNTANAVLSTGYNGFPRGVMDEGKDVPSLPSLAEMQMGFAEALEARNRQVARVEARHERPIKYKWTEHAERNAIYNAARHGIALNGSRIYLPWYPCMDCARAVIQAGITEMVCIAPNFADARWGEDFKLVDEMVKEAGLHVRYVDYPQPKTKAELAAEAAK